MPFYFQDYQSSLNDLNKVLRLDSSIAEAKMELEEVTRFLNVKDQAASLSKEKERRKIEIQEVFVFDYLWKYFWGILHWILRSYSYEFYQFFKNFVFFILMLNEEI